jgi:hypothetical protein
LAAAVGFKLIAANACYAMIYDIFISQNLADQALAAINFDSSLARE